MARFPSNCIELSRNRYLVITQAGWVKVLKKYDIKFRINDTRTTEGIVSQPKDDEEAHFYKDWYHRGTIDRLPKQRPARYPCIMDMDDSEVFETNRCYINLSYPGRAKAWALYLANKIC